MDLLFVTATAAEAVGAGLLAETKGVNSGDLIHLDIPGYEADLLVTGVGLTATAYQLGRLLTGPHYRLAVNLGIAGAFREDVELAKVFQVTKDSFGDLGAESPVGFLSVFDLNLAGSGEFPFQEGYIHQDLPAGWKNPPLPAATGISMNKVHGQATSIAAFRKRFPEAELESMEGAAFFFACRNAGQPCIQLRSVSNFIGPRNRESWKIKEALSALKEVVQLWLKENQTV